MKLPSIQESLREANSTFLRFPLVIAAAALGTLAAIILTDYDGPSRASVLFKILLAAGLGVPALISVSLVNEKKGWHGPKAISLHLAGLLLLAAYAFTVPANLSTAPASTMIRFSLLATALHLVVAVAPFTPGGVPGGFWTFNKTLFVRFLTAFLYANILWIGLAIAIEAVKHLFGLDIPSKREFEIWIIITGLFMTWFFLAGVPRDPARLESAAEYPRGIRVFALYVLFPLVLVYLVILFAYMAKIVIAWDWPQGWVSKLILGYAGAAIFALLLVHPIAGRAENVWMKSASRLFYLLLIPLMLMLFLAVWRRVSEYGVTPGRYFALMMGVWLSGLAVYYLLSHAKSIRVIPLTLCLVVSLASFGPWGMLSVSEMSQVSRFRSLAEKTGILVEGKIAPLHAKISDNDATRMQAILSYLGETHGYGEIEEWFGVSLREDSTALGGAWKNAGAVSQLMSLRGTGGVERIVELAAAQDGIMATGGYDHMVHAVNIMTGKMSASSSAEQISFKVEDSLHAEQISFSVEESLHAMILSFRHKGKDAGSISLDLRPLVRSVLSSYPDSLLSRIPGEGMSAGISTGWISLKVFFSDIVVQIHGTDTTVTACGGDIFYAWKKGM